MHLVTEYCMTLLWKQWFFPYHVCPTIWLHHCGGTHSIMSLCPCLTHIIAPLGWGCTHQGMKWQLVSCPVWVVICGPMPTSNSWGFLNQNNKFIWHSVTLHLPCGWASHGCTTACSRTMFLDHWGGLCSPISMAYIFGICIFSGKP